MYVIPAIEKFTECRLFDQISDGLDVMFEIHYRRMRAMHICNYLQNPRPNKKLLEKYYLYLYRFLFRVDTKPDSARIVLYLPFEELERAPKYFREQYLKAWRICLQREDVRENFNLGDCFEPSARGEDFDSNAYVVKAAHLLPWLVRYDYLSDFDVLELLEQGNATLKRSICDCKELFSRPDFLVGDELLARLSEYDQMYPRRNPKPLFDSPERQEWLKSQSREEWGSVVPHNICGPFSENFDPQIAPRTEGSEIMLIGGSRLKGYSTDMSDSDIFYYDIKTRQIQSSSRETIENFQVPDPNIAHICLCSVWQSNRKDLERFQNACIRRYAKLPWLSPERRQCVERIEQDLLQYRFMHKGFKRIFGEISSEVRDIDAMDGASAFYDRRYRRIATQLYAKYVFLPQLRH